MIYELLCWRPLLRRILLSLVLNALNLSSFNAASILMPLAAASSFLGCLVCRGVDDIVLPSLSNGLVPKSLPSVFIVNGVTENLVVR